MKQLKFNSDKDMKELEKYNFNLINYDNNQIYHKRVELEDIKAIDYYFINYNLAIKTHGTLDEVCLDNTIYDLIKANLLIVEESDN